MTNPFDEPCQNLDVSGESSISADWSSNRVEILDSNSFPPGSKTNVFASYKLTKDIVAFTIPVLKMRTSNNVEAFMIRTLEQNGTKVSDPEPVTWFLNREFFSRFFEERFGLFLNFCENVFYTYINMYNNIMIKHSRNFRNYPNFWKFTKISATLQN